MDNEGGYKWSRGRPAARTFALSTTKPHAEIAAGILRAASVPKKSVDKEGMMMMSSTPQFPQS